MAPHDDLEGRDVELALLRRRLSAAVEGRGGLVVVSGEAGIGKSAVAESIAREAEGLGFRVLTGRAWEFADAPAYFPLRGGLRALGVTPAVPAASDTAAFGLWEDVLEALAREGARMPVLWWLEDLHAADAQTLELLAFLAQPLRALPVVVLGTVRTGEERGSAAVAARLTRVLRDATGIELPRLDEAAVATIAARIAGRPLPVASIDAWMSRTGGNPLFVVECARAVRGGRGVESALPGTVVQVVVERLHGLPPATRAFLEQGAVLGRDFSASTVARIAGRLPAVVIDALLPALRAGIIGEIEPGSYRFAHALVRDAIEESLPASLRRDAHARAATALTEQGDAPTVVAEKARHAIEGLGILAEDDIGEIVARAMAALEGEGAHDRALSLWQRWIDARIVSPDGAALLTSARIAMAAGQHAESQRAADAAFAHFVRSNDPVGAAGAALARGAVLRPGIIDPLLVRNLEQALAALPPGLHLALECRVRARLAAALQPAPDPRVPMAMAREAMAMARATGDAALLRDVIFVAASALVYFAETQETHAIASELHALSVTAGDDAHALRALSRLVVGDLELGDFAAFEANTDRMLDRARALGHPSHAWRPLLVGSMRALAHGSFEESERLVTEVEQMARITDDPALVLTLAAHKAHRTLCLDDPEAIRGALDSTIPGMARTAGSFRAMILGLFAVRLGDRAAALAELPALEQVVAMSPRDSTTNGTFGEAAALAGTTEQRAAAFARLLPLEGRELHQGHIVLTYEGPVARVLGLLEASLGRTEAACERLAATRARCRSLGLRPWVARLALEEGSVLAAADQMVEARPLFEEAETLADELGMKGTATRAREALAAVAYGPGRTLLAARRVEDASRRQAADRAALVFVREGEVWRVSLGARTTHVRDSRGVRMLAKLVGSAGERVHALALDGNTDAFLPESSAGEALDAKAIAAYRKRLSAIDDDLAEAEARGDIGRMDRYRHEREALVAEIARAVGLGGLLRKVGSATERARINVTRRLKDAIARIAEADAEVGRHLRAAVRTGTYCSYGREP